MESKDKTNDQTKQNRNRLIDIENKPVVARGEMSGRMDKTDLPVIKYVRHRDIMYSTGNSVTICMMIDGN